MAIALCRGMIGEAKGVNTMKVGTVVMARANNRLVGVVIATWIGTAMDGTYYQGRMLTEVRWRNGSVGRWDADSLKQVRQ